MEPGIAVYSGEYEQSIPLDTDYRFKQWSRNADGSGSAVDVKTLGEDTVLYALYEEDIYGKGTYGCA